MQKKNGNIDFVFNVPIFKPIRYYAQPLTSLPFLMTFSTILMPVWYGRNL